MVVPHRFLMILQEHLDLRLGELDCLLVKQACDIAAESLPQVDRGQLNRPPLTKNGPDVIGTIESAGSSLIEFLKGHKIIADTTKSFSILVWNQRLSLHAPTAWIYRPLHTIAPWKFRHPFGLRGSPVGRSYIGANTRGWCHVTAYKSHLV